MPQRPAPVEPARYSRDYFAASCGGHEFFRRYGPTVLKPSLADAFRRAAVRAGMRVLDVGCGRGELLYHARAAGAWGVGTDYAPAAAALSAESSGAAVVLADAKALPFAAGLFDRIFFVGVIDHLHDWELERCFAEMGRVLKPGGLVLVQSCANRNYYKNWTYGFRRQASRLLRAVGIPVRGPAPPRSDEDEALHVNEHGRRDLERFFGRIGWRARVEARPNYRVLLDELYDGPLPSGFPLRPAGRLKRALYRGLLFRGPLRDLLGRELAAVASPGTA